MLASALTTQAFCSQQKASALQGRHLPRSFSQRSAGSTPATRNEKLSLSDALPLLNFTSSKPPDGSAKINDDNPSFWRLPTMSLDTSALRTGAFWLRVVQVVFAIIAFAPVAEGAGYSRFDFAIFCGVTTMLFSLVLALAHLFGVKQVKGLVSLIYDGIWFIFWLSCAAALSDMLGWYFGGSSKSRVQCAVAFSWLTWFLFIGAVVLDVIDLRSGGTVVMAGASTPAGGKAGAPPTGAVVASAV